MNGIDESTSLASLRKEREKAEERVRQLSQAIRALEQALDGLGTVRGNPTVAATRPGYKEDILGVLPTSGPGWKVREILTALTERGKPVETADPYRTIFKVLKQGKEFRQKEGRWWRKE